MMDIVGAKTNDEFELSDAGIDQENVEYILMDGYQYCFNRIIDNAQMWTCSNPSCIAYFKILNNKLLPGVMGHCHPRVVEISRQVEYMKIQPPGQGVDSASPKILGTKRKRVSESTKSSMTEISNRSDESRHVAGSVKKNLARQWTLSTMGSGPAGTLNRVPALNQNPLQAPTDFDEEFPVATNSSSPLPAPSRMPSPAKSPKLSEMGPPPTPPPSQPSPTSDHEGPCSSDLFELSDLKYSPHSEPDYDFSQPSWTFPQDDCDSVLSTTRPSSAKREHFKYKEYEDMMMQLNNQDFGRAVSSLLNELPSHSSERVRSKITALLYKAVEGSAKCSPKT